MAKGKRSGQSKQQKSESVSSSMSPTTQDILCIAFLYVVTLVVFRGIIFTNAAFSTEADTATALAYEKAGQHIEETEHVDAVWMPYIFSGMPTFGNVAYVPHNVNYVQKVLAPVLNLLYLNGQWTWFVVFYFLGGVFMFFLSRVWKFSRLAALLAAVTFMLSPYAIGLAGEGHGSKLMAVAYIPLVFLLTHMVFERRNLLTFGLLAASIGTLLLTNHMQIVYYAFIVIGLYLLYHVVIDFKEKKGAVAATKLGLFLGAVVLGLLISSYIYLSVYEYAQYSIRGGGTTGASGGLTWDYATNWSWNPWEVLTLLVPSFFGFQSPFYWGTMPFTNSTVYVGVIPVLLSVIAISYRRTRPVIFLAILTAIIFLMSFGKHFSLVYGVLFSYLPFFNKFRAPVMVLHVLPFTLGLMAAAGLTFLIEARSRGREFNAQKFAKVLGIIAGAFGILLIVTALFKSSVYQTLAGSLFSREGEAAQVRQQYGQQAPQVLAYLKETRFDMLWKDFIKFVVIAVVSASVIIGFLKNKIQEDFLGIALLGILIIDLMIIDAKFINPRPSADITETFQMDATMRFLKEHEDEHRVFPVGQLFTDYPYATKFLYHAIASAGGYSPAKLKIYQTMLDSCVYHGPDPTFPLNMNIVNMLSAKYLIAQGRLPEDRFSLVNVDQSKSIFTYENRHMLPRAWFVKDVITASTDHETFEYLNSAEFDASMAAILEKPISEPLGRADSTHVEVRKLETRDITLTAYTSAPSLLVLSEIYYPAGWKAYVDGTETEIYRTNYILRSVRIPAGSHDVELRFTPTFYETGWVLSNVSWSIVGLVILLGLWQIPSIRLRLGGKRSEHAGAPS